MSTLLSAFGSGFSFLSTEIFGLSIISWLVIGALLGLVGAFIRGKK